MIVTCGLVARAIPTGRVKATPATIGTTTTSTLTVPGVIYAIKVTSAASSNVATLTAGTGDVAQTTGSPVILRAGQDFQGLDLGSSTKIHGLRLRTSGTGTVALVGSSALLPSITLQSGSDLVVKFPDAGATLSAATLAATFSASGGILEIEAFVS